MAKGITDVIVKLGLDNTQFTQGLKKAGDDVKGFASSAKDMVGFKDILGGVELSVAGLLAATIKLAERGRDFNELANSFKALGGTDADLTRLRSATQGLVTDIELFKSANLAESLGITQQAFGQLAESADTLGDAVGVGTVEALNSLVRAMGTGQARALRGLGITIDSEKAEREFAAAIGTTADKLNEKGKLAAFQAETLRVVAEKTRTLSGDTISSADAFEQASNAVSNFIDRLSSLVDKSPLVAGVFQNFANGVKILQDSLLGTDTLGQDIAAQINSGIVKGLADSSAIDAEIAKTKQRIAQIRDANVGKDGPEYDNNIKAIGYLDDRLDLLGKQYDVLKPKIVGNKADFIGTAASAKEAAKALEDFTTKLSSDKLKAEADTLKDSFDRIFSSISGSTNANFQEHLIGGATEFNSQLEALKKNVREAYIQGVSEAYRDDPRALAAADEAAEKAATALRDKMGEAVSTTAVKLGDELKSQIQASADFFSDAFYNVFTGASFDFGDMLKRVGAGLAGGILGNIFPEFGNIGNLQQLGQKVGGELIKGILGSVGGGGATGGGGALSSLLGLGSGGLIGSLFNSGSYGVPGGLIGPAQSPGTGILSAGGLSAANLGIAGAAAGTAYFVFNTTSDNFSGKNKGVDKGESAGYAALDSIFPGVGSALSKVFGGGRGKGGREADQRQAFIDSLGSKATFGGINGPITLNPNDYNFQGGTSRTGLTDQSVGLTRGLAGALGGDNKKLTEDLNNIFAGAVDGGKNFNEVLIQAQSLMQSLGVDAGKAKDDITNLWLDGKVSIDDYNASIQSLNQLQADNLQGTGNVADAISVLSDTSATARSRIHAIGLAFTEMNEIGVDTSSETAAYLTDKFGPDVAKVFAQLQAAGINSFDKIKNASSDQINTIANILQGANFSQQFADQAKNAADATEVQTQRMIDGFKAVTQAASDAANSVGLIGGKNGANKSGNSSKVNENPANTPFVP